MVSDVDVLNKGSIVKIPNPKSVFLPNGYIACVTHIGSSSISTNNTLSNVFFLSQFKYNLMSLSKVTRDLQYSVTFFPDFCVFQDLFNGQVKEIGKECDSLYLLVSQSTRRSEELTEKIRLAKKI